MFCYQCQETVKNEGCTVRGACGKRENTANLQDLLLYILKGAAYAKEEIAKDKTIDRSTARFVCRALFTTITNGNFDDERFIALIRRATAFRDDITEGIDLSGISGLHDSVTWTAQTDQDFEKKAKTVGVLSTGDEDVRSLREILVYGLKGIAAYANHAAVLGYEDDTIYAFVFDALSSTLQDLSVDEMVGKVLKAGEIAVTTMALLDTANTSTFGNPVTTKVSVGVRKNPGILVSGHDLKDMAELLKQTESTGVDVYTHGEMLPAHYYPYFQKYSNLAGNYGGSWWRQGREFDTFHGPILMTTNCIVPVRDSYKDRIFTTGTAGYPGLKHIADPVNGGGKDFSEIIELAKKCSPPQQIETGEIVGGFAHQQILEHAETIVDAVKSGAIKKFVVMAGCDGRQAGREYFTEVAERLPSDTIILTAGCAKYRYNKLELGDIGGIPRVLDAGQCNDSYSLAFVALKLKEVFGLDDINDLPIVYDIAWYEQKAVAVLLALLHLGVKGIRLGPTLPGFLSPAVAKTLVETFDLKPTASADEDIAAMM